MTKRGGTTVTGYAWMSLAVLIWASWLVLTSSERTTALSVVDLATFRAVIPTILLAPLLWSHRLDIARLGPIRCLLLSAYGAPFTLFVGFGLTLAPAAHAGALVPGLMPVIVIALGRVFLGQQVTFRQKVAICLIILGTVSIMLRGPGAWSTDHISVGHTLFLLGALSWASFTVTMQTLAIPPFLATAIVGAISTAVLLPVWILSGLSSLSRASAGDIAFQAVFQGIIAGLVSIYAFGLALRLIGGHAATMSALTPGVAAMLAVPLLGQVPDLVDILALGFVVAGLVVRASETRGMQTDMRPIQDKDNG